MHKKTYINICVPLLVFFITTSVFELTLSSVLSFSQCDLSCCLYIVHIPRCILMSYMCLFELILSLILSFPHWNLSYPMHKKIHTVSARIIERSQEDKSMVKYRTFVLLRVPIRSGVGKFNYRTGRRTKVRYFTVLLSSWLRSIISGTDMIFTAYLYIYNYNL